MKKTIVYAILLVGVAAFFLPMKEPAFSFSLVTPSLRSGKKWTLHALSSPQQEEVKTILSQKFTYIGCGAQAYVFSSEDGHSVLKLFKKKRFETSSWIQLLPPLPYKLKKIAAKRGNLDKDFTSYQIAFDELQEQTGLLLVHLQGKSLIEQPATLIDDKKSVHQVNLSDYAFILQKKGELIYSTLERFVQEGTIPAAKEALTSLLHLLKSRCTQGVADRDPNFGKNFALLGTTAVQIDIGRFSHTAVKAPKIPEDFKTWLQNLSPELLEHFEKEYETVF